MTQEGKKLAAELGRFVLMAATSLEQKARMRNKIHEALNRRVRKVIKETREQRANQALGDHLDLRRAALVAGGVEEGWADFGGTIAKGALRAVGHGLGIKAKSGAVKNVMAAVKKKKKKRIVVAKAKVDLPALHQKPKLNLSTKQRYTGERKHMRKIRQINVGGITGSGQRIDMPVDVYGETWASDEIFNASNITQGAQQPHRDDPEPTQQWPDATFSPQNWDVTPKPPRGSSDTDEQ